MTSLMDLYLEYHRMRGSSPMVFGTYLCLQITGQSLGRESKNMMKPKGERHNIYLCLLGPSGGSMKTTAQEDIALPLIPNKYRGPRHFSPEGLLRSLEEKPKCICSMGEFSTVLRGIKMGGHMSNFKEYSNELFTCPDIYDKILADKDKKYLVKYPYLSFSSTCTEEEFFENLKPEMVHGGFLPRWLLPYAPKQKKSREDLPEHIDKYESILRCTFNEMFKNFDRHPAKFSFTVIAKETYFNILDELEGDGNGWDDVQPFVSRYGRYIIKIADILFVCDKIGEIFEKKYGVSELSKVNNINKLNELKNKILSSLQSDISLCMLFNSLNSVDETYVKRAWEIVKPTLLYVKKISKYVDEEFYIAKVKRQIESTTELKIGWSWLLRRSAMSSKKFLEILFTLQEREEIDVIVETKGEGHAKKDARYIVKTKNYR